MKRAAPSEGTWRAGCCLLRWRDLGVGIGPPRGEGRGQAGTSSGSSEGTVGVMPSVCVGVRPQGQCDCGNGTVARKGPSAAPAARVLLLCLCRGGCPQLLATDFSLRLTQRSVASACPVVGGLPPRPWEWLCPGERPLLSPWWWRAPCPGFGRRRGEQGACRSAPMGMHGRRLQGQRFLRDKVLINRLSFY